MRVRVLGLSVLLGLTACDGSDRSARPESRTVLEFLEDPPGTLEMELALVRETEPPRRAVEQAHAERGLERNPAVRRTLVRHVASTG